MHSQDKLAARCTAGGYKKCFQRGTCLWGYTFMVYTVVL